MRSCVYDVMPAEAGIQYSETQTMESRTRGILDTRLRGYDGGGGREKPAELAEWMLSASSVGPIPSAP
jgi:hypothetical protein